MAGFVGVQAQQITTAEKTGTTGNPECTYTTGTGRHEIKLLADDYKGSQPYFILDRTAEEAAQVFVPTRMVAPPVAINHIGLEAVWFPAREQLMATDGLKLITTTVTWKGVTQKHRLALAEAFIKPYIKVTKQGRAAAKLFPYPARVRGHSTRDARRSPRGRRGDLSCVPPARQRSATARDGLGPSAATRRRMDRITLSGGNL